MIRKKISCVMLALVCLALGSCDVLRPSAGPATPSGMPGIGEAGETQIAGMQQPLTLEEGKLYVAIIWHMHQPMYFKDPETGIYERPWVRVHAAKDYLDMATTLDSYPELRVTFNLTPSLIQQLDDIGAGAQDLYAVYTEIPAEELSETQKAFILDRFFDINPEIISRFPRYEELSRLRSEEPLSAWTAQDFRDLQVLFNLAWTDPDWLAIEPLAGLVSKGEGYQESDKATVLNEHLRIVQQVIPVLAGMQQAGQIEITTSPYAHPILPLLVDSDLARVALPDATLPTRFVFGQDAVGQLDLGVQLYEEHFGMAPHGLWPPEGAVAEQIVSMVSSAGIEWMATDEQILAASLPDILGFTRDSSDTVQQADVLYRPYAVQGARGDPVAILFRDHLISDKVGFEYSGMPGEDAALDFITRLEAIRARLQEEGAAGPHLVTVLLDGENAWEYYDNDGKAFLNEVYRLLSESETLETVTPSEYLAALQDQGEALRPIETLWAGSWVDGTFSTWIGEEEENEAWEYLRRTREALRDDAPSLSESTLAEALRLMYIAEGSDWFWWYGADQNSGADENFDQQFRNYLAQIYNLIGLEVPDYVYVPVIPQSAQPPDQEPADLLAVRADGVASPGEWDDAGHYALTDGRLTDLYYGFDEENLFLRVDSEGDFSEEAVLGFYISTPQAGPANASSREGEGITTLGFGAKQLIEVTFEGGKPVATAYVADGTGDWLLLDAQDPTLEDVALRDGCLEIVAPLARFAPEARSGDRINLRLVLSQGGVDLAVIPSQGPVLATVPDLPIANVFMEFLDPSHDDYGPGSYVYPKDAVFKPGVFDITGLTIGYDEEDYIFRLQFRGPVINEWGSPNGLSVQTIDIYLDVDGPASGSRLLLPGRNAALSQEYAWDYAIWAEGWTPGIYVPSEAGPVRIDSSYTIITNPGQRRVTIRVPKNLLEGDPLTWKLAVAILGQEGYPAAGVWRVRNVQPEAEQWRFGGGTGALNETRIIDLLWPEENAPNQEELLSNVVPVFSDLDSLDPDQFPQLPMITP